MHMERNGAACHSYINYRLKSEVSITLHCQLCSTRYTAVRIKNCSKSASAIKVTTIKNTDVFHYEGNPSCATTKSTLLAVSKDEWNTKEDTSNTCNNSFTVLTAIHMRFKTSAHQTHMTKKLSTHLYPCMLL